MLVDGFALRERIFRDLAAMMPEGRDYVTRRQLESYSIDGNPLPLVDGQQAIHNPKAPIELDATLSVYTKPGSRYDDGDSSDGVWKYGYTGETPGGRNIKLRRAYQLGLPIIYFDWIAPAVFAPLFPVYVVDDRPNQLHVLLAYDKLKDMADASADTPVERAYREAVVKQRIHQREFRARVLYAYGERCAICGLPHASLLDAAHIRPYGEPGGEREVRNGLALCAIHHRAYDTRLLGVDGERRLHVHPDVASVSDGPIWEAGLQALPGTRLKYVPGGKLAPDPDRLELTFKEFLDALPSPT